VGIRGEFEITFLTDAIFKFIQPNEGDAKKGFAQIDCAIQNE
jgi:hypothetical protein